MHNKSNGSRRQEENEGQRMQNRSTWHRDRPGWQQI